MIRRFHLVREADVSGISGVGIVAEGVQFSDGRIYMRWLGNHPTTEEADSIAEIEFIHGHGGLTKIIWVD